MTNKLLSTKYTQVMAGICSTERYMTGKLLHIKNQLKNFDAHARCREHTLFQNL